MERYSNLKVNLAWQNNINLDLHYNLTEHITVRYSQHTIKVLIFFSYSRAHDDSNSLWYAAPALSAIDFSSPLCADVCNKSERLKQYRANAVP